MKRISIVFILLLLIGFQGLSWGEQVYALKIGERKTEIEAGAAKTFWENEGYGPVFIREVTQEKAWEVYLGTFDFEIEAWAMKHLMEAKGEIESADIERIEIPIEKRLMNCLPFEKPFDFSQLEMPFSEAEFYTGVQSPDKAASESVAAATHVGMTAAQLADRIRYSGNARDVVQGALYFLEQYPSDPNCGMAKQNLLRGMALGYQKGLNGGEWNSPSIDSAEVQAAAKSLLEDSSREVRSNTRKLLHHLKRWRKEREECTGKAWNSKWGWRGIERGRLRMEFQADALAEADNEDNTALDRLDLAMRAAYYGSALHSINRGTVLASTCPIDLGSSLSWYAFSRIAEASQVPEPVRAETGLMQVGVAFELYLQGVVGNQSETARIATDYLSSLGVEPVALVDSQWPDWKKYDVVRAKLMWGETHWRANQPLIAIPIFTSILDSTPEVGVMEYSTALKMRALCHIKSGSDEAAIADYERLFAHAGKTRKAVFTKKVMLNTTIPESLYRCAQAYTRVGRNDLALELCNTMVAEWDNEWNPWLKWAKSLISKIEEES